MPSSLRELWYFGIKQAWACLFGGVLLFFILLTGFYWPENAPIARYDFLFLIALATQGIFLLFRLETPEEARVIFVFHIVGTVMEIFKTHVGSWVYPEDNLIRIGGVPLFSGFMYSAVGSYIARIWRIFEFKFRHYPPKRRTVILATLIYINFFTHHYIYDFRYILFACTALLFGRTWVYGNHHNMPLLLGFVLVTCFIWLAENFATLGTIWLYPDQIAGWQMVSFAKMGSWFLLMIISFVLVSLLHQEKR